MSQLHQFAQPEPIIQLGRYDSENKQIKWVDFSPNERNQNLFNILVDIFSLLPKISKIAVGCLNLGIFHFFRNYSSASSASLITQTQIDEMGYQLAKALSHHDQNWRVEYFYSDESTTPDFFAETPIIKELRKKYNQTDEIF